ncbi:MAG: hypothetical protein NTY31_03375 [Candidatus Falkowbacteria bacterium]|nr:hypothetical protein [Candidatus Falkowbacteria bacterium]
MVKKIFFIFVLAFISLSFSLSRAQAQIISDPGVGLNETANIVPAFQNQTGNTYGSDFLATKAGLIIGVILSFVGVLFLILMIYAGILWMTASGNDEQIKKAKGLLVNAAIGIIIVFSAYALTTFLGTQLLL